jgi:hypothetical protein
MPNKNCQSCADKIIKMRELKKQRIKEEQQKQLLNNNISFSTIKDIIKK